MVGGCFYYGYFWWYVFINFLNMEKGNRIRKICDGVTTLFNLKGYIMFEDNWITEYDKVLYNQKGEMFTVLDFVEVEENVLMFPDMMPYFDGWKLTKLSCVKLDKKVDIDNIFYTQLNY